MASAGVSTAFMPGTGIWTLGASIAQTLFDGGKLEHTKLAAVAAYDKAAAQYRSTVLLAFQDVANALRVPQADADTLKATVAAEHVVAASLALVQQQYAPPYPIWTGVGVAQLAMPGALLEVSAVVQARD